MTSHLKYSTGVGRGGRQQPAGGRPKGSKNKRQPVQVATLIAGRKLPLEYMIEVFNDPNVPEERRDRFAIAAAPYLHPRLSAVAEPKALFEMTDEELDHVMRKEMLHAESQGDFERATQIHQLLYGEQKPAGPSAAGNGAAKPV